MNLLKQEAQSALQRIRRPEAGTRSTQKGNVDEEPPAFESIGRPTRYQEQKELAPNVIEEAIRILSAHIGRQKIRFFISVLEAPQTNPQMNLT